MYSNTELTRKQLKKLITKFEGKLVWKKLSANMSLPLSIDVLEQYKDRWSWNLISQNENVIWHLESLEKFKDQLSWNWISKNESVRWCDEILDTFAERIMGMRSHIPLSRKSFAVPQRL